MGDRFGNQTMALVALFFCGSVLLLNLAAQVVADAASRFAFVVAVRFLFNFGYARVFSRGRSVDRALDTDRNDLRSG